jgi:hypothetical protein
MLACAMRKSVEAVLSRCCLMRTTQGRPTITESNRSIRTSSKSRVWFNRCCVWLEHARSHTGHRQGGGRPAYRHFQFPRRRRCFHRCRRCQSSNGHWQVWKRQAHLLEQARPTRKQHPKEPGYLELEVKRPRTLRRRKLNANGCRSCRCVISLKPNFFDLNIG